MKRFSWMPVYFLVCVTFTYACQHDMKQAYKEGRKLHVIEDEDKLNAAISKYRDVIRYAILALNGQYEAWKAYGIQLLEHHMYREALKAFIEAERILASDSNLHYYKGLAYANLADVAFDPREKQDLIQDAKRAYMHALRFDEDNTIVHYALGVVCGFVEGDTKQALIHMQQAYQLEPKSVEVLFALGRLHYELDNPLKALECYQSIRELTPSQSESHLKATAHVRRITQEVDIDQNAR